MSGVAGGQRIVKADVQKTFDSYVNNVLKKIPGFKKATLSGSVKVGTKPDYGDLDLITLFEGTDKKEVKQSIIEVVTRLPDTIIVPFKSEKHAGKKYYNAGELISVLYPIQGQRDSYIQIDNIIALTEEEHLFKNSFLDLPAEKQGLLIGLAKVILLERDPEVVFSELGIKRLPTLKPNEEFEFNLSSAKLTLRRVLLDSSRKEIDRTEVWTTTNWNTINNLFQGFNIEGTFEDLLSDLAAKLKSSRSKQRIAGIFKSMVTVKSGEQGTAKGLGKEKALAAVTTTLTENKGEVVALYGGGFKPPHKAHFENAVKLSQQADRLIIFIGPKQREGLPISPEQAKQVWELYARYIGKPVEIYISQVTPIRDLYEWVDANQDRVSRIITGATKDDFARFNTFIKNKDKYPKVDLVELPVITSAEDSKLSATNIRQSEEYLRSGQWLPDKLDSVDVKKIVAILLPTFESIDMLSVNTVLEDFYKSTESLKDLLRPQQSSPIEPELPVIEPKKTELTVDLLQDRIANQLGTDYYSIEQEGNSIRITPKSTSKSEFDYTTHIVSILEYAIKTGVKLGNIPGTKLVSDREESKKLFGRTAYYNPDTAEIVVYVAGRHPKDILRSYCHELIHHIQNEEGRLHSIYTTDTTEDGDLQKLEEEAYLRGNMLFRNWEDTVKNENT